MMHHLTADCSISEIRFLAPNLSCVVWPPKYFICLWITPLPAAHLLLAHSKSGKGKDQQWGPHSAVTCGQIQSFLSAISAFLSMGLFIGTTSIVERLEEDEIRLQCKSFAHLAQFLVYIVQLSFGLQGGLVQDPPQPCPRYRNLWIRSPLYKIVQYLHYNPHMSSPITLIAGLNIIILFNNIIKYFNP
jgi:hypothetical protein